MNTTWKDLQKWVFFMNTSLSFLTGGQKQDLGKWLPCQPAAPLLPSLTALQSCLAHCLHLFFGSGSFTFLCWAGSSNMTTVIAKEVFLLYFFLTEPVFHMGKTYLYSYESIIVHGLPDRSLATAGVRLASKVEISRVSHSDHLLQVNHRGHRNPPTHWYHAVKEARFMPPGWQNMWQKDVELTQKLWALPTAGMTLQAQCQSKQFPSGSDDSPARAEVWTWALSSVPCTPQLWWGEPRALLKGLQLHPECFGLLAGTYREHHRLTHSLLLCRKELELLQLCCHQYLSPLD